MTKTSHPAFEKAFTEALQRLDKEYPEHCEMAMPYLIGCGLAGGEEEVITKIIDGQVDKYGGKFHVTAYRLKM